MIHIYINENECLHQQCAAKRKDVLDVTLRKKSSKTPQKLNNLTVQILNHTVIPHVRDRTCLYYVTNRQANRVRFFKHSSHLLVDRNNNWVLYI